MMINLIDEILKSKNLSKTTQTLYAKSLIQIINDLKFKSINDFNNFDLVKDYLDNKYKNLSTYKTFLNAIININSTYSYQKLRDDLQKKINLLKGNNYKNENKNISYDDLKKIINFNIEATNKFDYLKKYNDELLLYFSILYPLRLDYWNIKLYYSKVKPDVANYIRIYNKYIELHLNDYKTKSIYGEFKNRFNGIKTLNLLNKYIELYKDCYGVKPDKLFNYASKITFARHLKELLYKKTKLDLSNNDIRHLYETHFIQSPEYKYLTNNQKEKYSNKILHSHAEALKSYNKV